jgi:acetyl-CoA carboxylase biotin carboxyl carrier protein
MGKSSSGAGVFDLGRIRELVELMKEHDLREIDLREGEQGIKLCRAGQEVVMAPVQHHAAPAAPAVAPVAAAPAGDGPNIVVIKSPMVGTYYNKPNPKSEAFVKVGDHIEATTTICIIEAMKVFNEIPAEIAGKVVAILVQNEESVDFGKPLFKIDTSK